MQLPITIRWPVLVGVLKDGWPAWLTLAGLVVAFALGALFGKTKAEAVLFAGVTLQLFGLVIVAQGLHDMRRLFGRPALPAQIAAWFRSLFSAFLRPKPITLQASAAGAAAVAGDLSVARGANPNTTLEERISVLEADIAILRAEHEKHVRTIKQEIGQLRDDGHRQASELRSADEAANRKIEEVAIGGLHLETAGLVWLSVGVIAGSIPDQVADLLGRIF